MRRLGFTSFELSVVLAVVAFLLILLSSSGPARPHRLDDRFGYLPLAFVLLWGIDRCVRHFRKDPMKAGLVASAIVLVVLQLLFRRWGMYVKDHLLLNSSIDPFYWEALLTCAISLPFAAVLAMLFIAAFRENSTQAELGPPKRGDLGRPTTDGR